jgi:glycosyltransferase involved in cell wall biosynthesis
MKRLAIVTSHPIQYHSPLFRALARVTDLEVFYGHRQDASGQADAGFGAGFEWDVPLLGGYRHTFLRNRASNPNVFSFGGCDTPEIAAMLRAGGFDACLITGWYLKSYLQALFACRRLGIPALGRGDSQLATARSAVWSAAKYLPYRVLLNQYSAHLYVGIANRAYLEHYGVPDTRLFFTPHFVDNAFFSTRADAARRDGTRDRIRRECGIQPGDFALIFVGKLIGKKRPADFVRAIADAQRTDTRVRGIIVGSGPLEEETRELVRNTGAAVAFAGFQNQSTLPGYLSAADALVLPSDAGETWGLVVNEGMACGLPAVVSSAAGCARDLIDEGHTGFTFDVGDVERMSTAIRALAEMTASGRQAMQQAVAVKSASYSCDAAVQGVLAAIDGVARSRESR